MYGAIEVVRCISIFHTSLKRGCHSDRITLIYDLRCMSCLDNKKSLIENGLHQLLSLEPCVSHRLHLGHLLYQEVFWSNILGCLARNSSKLAFFLFQDSKRCMKKFWQRLENKFGTIQMLWTKCYQKIQDKKLRVWVF